MKKIFLITVLLSFVYSNSETIENLENLYYRIVNERDFTVGFDDLLSSMANEYERYMYKDKMYSILKSIR